MNVMGAITRLTKATSRSHSLRTTVPSSIVKQFNLEEQDSLEWSIEARGSKLVIVIKHLKQARLVKPKKRVKRTKSSQNSS